MAADEERDRGWAKVKEWRGTVTITANDTSSENDVTVTTNSSLQGSFEPLSLDAESDAGFRVWTGKLAGTMSINSKSVASTARMTQKWTGSGAIPADSQFKLALDVAKGTYELHLFAGEISGTVHTEQHLVAGPGVECCTTEPTTMAVGGFTRTFPLPQGAPRKLEQRFNCTFADCPVHGAGGAQVQKQPVLVVVSIEPVTKLKAVPGGPYEIERGQLVNLDGSRSEGAITKYTWKVAAGRCDGAPVPRKERDGATWSFTALCPISATLTVTDGQRSDSKRVTIKVNPRKFITQFSDATTEKPLDTGAPFYPVDAKIVGGENKCAIDPEPPHTLHPPAPAGTWDGIGYTLKHVLDDGPFNGFWYVDTEQLEIARQIAINKYLLPGGPPPLRGVDSIYSYNKAIERKNGTGEKGGSNIDGYLEAARAHEHLHSTKMREAVGRRDPALRIEPMIDRGDRAALKRRADKEIKQSELAICKAAQDPIKGERAKEFPLYYPSRTTGAWSGLFVGVGGPGEKQQICD